MKTAFAVSMVLVASACATPAPVATAPHAAASTAPELPTPAADLFEAIKAEDVARVDRLLSADRTLVDVPNAKGRSPVLAAMFILRHGESFIPVGDNSTLQAVLAHGPALDPMLVAAFGDAGRVKQEIARDSRYVRARHPLGWTALHFAAFAGNAATAGALLDAGADVDAVADSSFKNTPLQVTTLTQSVQVARLLIARGADVKHRQEGGFTALHEAVQSGNREMVAVLLDAGADPMAAADDGKTPMDIAHARGNADLAALLSAHGAGGAGASSVASTAPAQVAWRDMTYAQRSRLMKDVVVPRMREHFTAFDGKQFATFDCATCHGAGATDGSFRMPNPLLARLPSSAAGFQALARDKPEWMSFMAKQVRPHMAALLGVPEIDMRHPTPDAFGCRNCHVLSQ